MQKPRNIHVQKFKIFSASLKRNNQNCVSNQAVTLSAVITARNIETVLLSGRFFKTKQDPTDPYRPEGQEVRQEVRISHLNLHNKWIILLKEKKKENKG